MKTLQQNLFLVLTAAAIIGFSGCSSSDGSSSSDINTASQYQPAGWYMKTGVSATASDGTVYTHTSAGVFGELVQSEEGKDRHDVPGYGSAILQIVFPQLTWEDASGDYFSDYRAYDETNTSKKSWTFQIKNQHTVDLANAPITITLDGAYDVTYLEDENGYIDYKVSTAKDSGKKSSVTLVDVDNGDTYSFDELATAGLTMDGMHTRTFRWVLGEVDDNDMAPLAVSSVKQSSASKALPTAVPSTKESKFGLPPAL